MRRQLVYYTDENPLVQTNMAMLLAAYMLMCHGWSAEEAVKPFAMIEPNPFKPFRDATYLSRPRNHTTQPPSRPSPLVYLGLALLGPLWRMVVETAMARARGCFS